MVAFIEDKKIAWNRVQELLQISADANHWTNFGPVSKLLEDRLSEILNIPADRTVLVCGNGTSAVFVLVEMKNYLEGKLIWDVSSFSFHCLRQGPMQGSNIIDCDNRGLLDVNAMRNNAVVVTNPFGVVDNLDEIRAKATHVICDSGSAFDALKCHNVDEAISFHHTKPWGFGEGGCIIIKKEHIQLAKALLNFGNCRPHLQDSNVKARSNNCKMSDISAAFILQHLDNIDKIRMVNRGQYERIVDIGTKLGFRSLIDRRLVHTPFCAPLIHDQEIELVENGDFKSHKYYAPLTCSPRAHYIYRHILCCPCHNGMASLSDQQIERGLIKTIQHTSISS